MSPAKLNDATTRSAEASGLMSTAKNAEGFVLISDRLLPDFSSSAGVVEPD
jgi:hypothetical protein